MMSQVAESLPELDAVVALVHEAGRIVMQVYDAGFDVRRKADASPVTEADERAEAFLVPALRALLPGVPVVAEEMAARGQADAIAADGRGCFWLVDPLDGTREFIKRNGEFTVNVALVRDGRAVLGVVGAPALLPSGRLYAGVVGQQAWVEDAAGRHPLQVRPVPARGLTVVSSRSHGDDDRLARFLASPQLGHPVAEQRTAGSSLKLCLVAAGEADLYPRLGRTMEWDIAAGHAVLAAAGGRVRTLDGEELRYGKPGFENPHFTARGGGLA